MSDGAKSERMSNNELRRRVAQLAPHIERGIADHAKLERMDAAITNLQGQVAMLIQVIEDRDARHRGVRAELIAYQHVLRMLGVDQTVLESAIRTADQFLLEEEERARLLRPVAEGTFVRDDSGALVFKLREAKKDAES